MITLLNRLAGKLKSWQTFIVVVLLIGYMYNDGIQKKQQTVDIIAQLEILNNNVINGSLDRLSYGGAAFLYDRTFNTAKGKIYKIAEKYINENTISNSYTQQTIRDVMYNRISYFYRVDMNEMKRYRYNGIALSKVMEDFDPKGVTDQICNCIFKDTSLPHLKIKANVRINLDDIFDDFTVRAVASLSK